MSKSSKVKEESDQNKLGVISAISYIVSIIIGTGIFISPTGILRSSGSVGLSLIIWLICGLVSICGALCYIELGTSIPRSGGDFTYQKYVGWDAVAFSLVVTDSIISLPASNAIQLTTISSYLIEAIQLYACLPQWANHFFPVILGLIILLFLTFLNFFSLGKYAAKLQIAAFITKVGSLLFISGVGIYYFAAGKASDAFSRPFDGTSMTSHGIITALYDGSWAFAGWNSLNYGLEDIKNPRVSLPVSAIGGLLIVILGYLLTNVAYFAVLDVQGMLSSDAVVVTFSNAALGPAFASIVPVVIGLMAATSLNAILFTSSRIYFAVGRDGHFPSCMSTLSPTHDSPRPALFAICGLTVVMMTIVGDLESLLVYVNFISWLSSGTSIAALIWIRFRRIPVDPKAIKMPVVIHVFFVLVCAYLVITPLYEQPILAGVGLGLVVGGVIVYFSIVRNPKLPNWLISFDLIALKFSQKLFVVESKKEKNAGNTESQNDVQKKLSSASPRSPKIYDTKF